MRATSLFLVGLIIEIRADSIHNVSLAPFHLLGYDCTAPRNIKDYTISQLQTGCVQAAQTRLVGQETLAMVLLQKEDKRREKAVRCQLKRTKLVRYCGVYDHQTTDDRNSYYHRLTPVSPDLCGKVAYEAKAYVTITTNQTILSTVKRNKVNYIDYFEAGDVYTDPSSGEVKCLGVKHYDHETKTHYERIVIQIKEEFTTTDEIVTQQGSQLIATPGNTLLNCHLDFRSCQTAEGTYVWRPRSNYCPLAVARDFPAARATDELNNVVVMSTDDSKIRLVDIGPVSYCDQVVSATNYPDLFLTPKWPTQLRRQLDPSELRLPAYINNRQDYLWNKLEDSIEQGFRQTLLNDCRLQKSQEQTQSWLRITDPGINTYLLGNGTFATTAGEVLYLYQCRPQEVRARHTTECYEALPVHYGNHSLFLEPLTHRLLRQGLKIPCSDRFLPKFHTLEDTWIMASPQILQANKPAPLRPIIDPLDFSVPQLPDVDWSTGGIYTDEDLNAMQNYLEFPRIRQALESHLAWQAALGHYDGSTPLTPSVLFPNEFPSLSGYILSGLWNALRQWGEFVSIVIALIVAGRILMWFLKIIFSCWALIGAHGITLHLLWFACSDWLYLLRYRKVHRQKNKREDPPAKTPEEEPLPCKNSYEMLPTPNISIRPNLSRSRSLPSSPRPSRQLYPTVPSPLDITTAVQQIADDIEPIYEPRRRQNYEPLSSFQSRVHFPPKLTDN